MDERAAALQDVLKELRKIKNQFCYNRNPLNDDGAFVKGCHFGFEDGIDHAIKTVEYMSLENQMIQSPGRENEG